ncbi:MAG: alpha/beta hydrolase [Lentisphaeria bacterium]|nr:alpha/beta hydrolase [Lentisphaeria bacterium]
MRPFFHACGGIFSIVAALGASLLLSGCFLFVGPEKSDTMIPQSRPGDRTDYALSASDTYSCMRIHLPPENFSRPCPAVVIFPGGAYGVLAWDKEGNDYAEFLNKHGMAGIVVKYPLGSMFGHFRRHPAMLNAAQRSIRLVRYHAKELGIDPKRIGVMGSSAGGHLAGLTAVRDGKGDPNSSDPVERVSAHPDFAVLCYPVVSMSAPCTHGLSRDNLVGSKPSDVLLRELSLELQIKPGCPPFFVWLTLEDKTVDPENSRLLEKALKRCRVPSWIIFYQHGPHGMGQLTDDEKKRYPETAQWSAELLKFLREQRILDPAPEKP